MSVVISDSTLEKIRLLLVDLVALGAGGTSDHSALDNLDVNDHPQYVQGLSNGLRVAAGVLAMDADTETVVTGLTTVVAAVAGVNNYTPGNATLAQRVQVVMCDIGDQAGAPAAGSIVIRGYKPAHSGSTWANGLNAANSFDNAPKIHWIAIGT